MTTAAPTRPPMDADPEIYSTIRAEAWADGGSLVTCKAEVVQWSEATPDVTLMLHVRASTDRTIEVSPIDLPSAAALYALYDTIGAAIAQAARVGIIPARDATPVARPAPPLSPPAADIPRTVTITAPSELSAVDREMLGDRTMHEVGITWPGIYDLERHGMLLRGIAAQDGGTLFARSLGDLGAFADALVAAVRAKRGDVTSAGVAAAPGDAALDIETCTAVTANRDSGDIYAASALLRLHLPAGPRSVRVVVERHRSPTGEVFPKLNVELGGSGFEVHAETDDGVAMYTSPAALRALVPVLSRAIEVAEREGLMASDFAPAKAAP